MTGFMASGAESRAGAARSAPRPGGGPREWVVDAEQAGQRIDNWLLARLKGVPKSHVYRILRRGEVRVNKGRIRPEYRLAAGDVVRVPPVRMGTEAPAAPGVPARLQADLAARVLYEDGDLLVLDKPAGLAVHGGSGVSLGAIEALRALRPQARFLELVHRLDRETSGCLLVAKRRAALRRLHEQLRAGAVEKRYLALAGGAWQGGERMVDLPLQKNVLRSGERMVRVDGAGREALSAFRPRAVTPDLSLLEVAPVTGRTHQIRVHAAAIGHPLAGDAKYGDEALNHRLRALGLRRLFLHAAALVLPGDGGLAVTATLPPELLSVLRAAGLPEEAAQP